MVEHIKLEEQEDERDKKKFERDENRFHQEKRDFHQTKVFKKSLNSLFTLFSCIKTPNDSSKLPDPSQLVAHLIQSGSMPSP